MPGFPGGPGMPAGGPGMQMPPQSPWPGPSQEEEDALSSKKEREKWEMEEELGDQATISKVLYVNMVHPELKQKYPGNGRLACQVGFEWD